MLNFAVFASGSGTNLQSIIENVESGYINAKLAVIITDNKGAYALERAKKHNIPAFCVQRNKKSREEHEKEINKILETFRADFIVLAGYMRLLTPNFIRKYKMRILNIHPALLPSFPGTHGYEDAWNQGVKVSGCTVHFVDEGVDTGPIILQMINPVKPDDTFESFRERGLSIEHKALPKAIKLYVEGKLKVEGRKVKVLE